MDTELYKTIEKLKETLAGVASARQQVGDTVAAYSRTQKDVQAFVGHIRSVEAALARVVSLLQANSESLAHLSDGVAEDFTVAADKAAAHAALVVGNAAASAAGQMGDASARFNAQVDSCASSLASLSDSVRHAVDSSAAGLDGVAARFDGQIESLSAQAEALRSEVGKVFALGETVDGNARSLTDISVAVNALRTELAELRREQGATLSAICDEERAGKRIGVATLVVAILTLVFLALNVLMFCGFIAL